MKFVFALVFSMVLSASAAASDYCLGEWTDDADTYCKSLMFYATTLTIDRNLHRPKAEVMAEVPLAVVTYRIPKTLAENYIEFIWQEPVGYYATDDPGYLLFGGCIDNFVELQTLGIEDAVKEQQSSTSIAPQLILD